MIQLAIFEGLLGFHFGEEEAPAEWPFPKRGVAPAVFRPGAGAHL